MNSLNNSDYCIELSVSGPTWLVEKSTRKQTGDPSEEWAERLIRQQQLEAEQDAERASEDSGKGT